MKKPVFFAKAPYKDYLYPLRIFKQRKELERKNFAVGIIDLGIYPYLLKNKGELYPKELIEGIYEFCHLRKENIWVDVPDYPPIIAEHISSEQKYDNVKETIKNWEKFREFSTNAIFTVQFRKLLDLKSSIEDLREFPKENKSLIGVGGLCRLVKNSNKERKYVKEILRIVREKYPKSWIHVWGLSLWHYKSLCQFGNSFDSSKWTRPVRKKILGNCSCKTQNDRIKYFNTYLEVMDEKWEKIKIGQ